MKSLKPKEQHERLLADADKAMIMQHLNDNGDQAVTKIAVMLARQCVLFVHFQRLWKMRVSDLDETLGTEWYMKNIYLNRKELYKVLIKTPSPQ